MLTTIAWIVGAVVAIDLALRLIYARIILKKFETAPPFEVPLYPASRDAEAVTCKTSDGVMLRGALHWPNGTPRGLILFFPEYQGAHWSAAVYARALLEAGYCLLAFDFRGQGDSDGLAGYTPNHWPSQYEARDVRAILGFLACRSDLAHLPWGVFGISRGASLAVVAAAVSPECRAVCCDGLFSVDSLLLYFVLHWAFLYLPNWARQICPIWHIRLTLWITRWASEYRRGVRYVTTEWYLRYVRERSVLLISGERDNYVHPEIAQYFKDRLRSPRASLWIVPKAKHNGARLVAEAEYGQRLVQFFEQAFQGTATTNVRKEA